MENPTVMAPPGRAVESLKTVSETVVEPIGQNTDKNTD
jgi:hypothetical protein